MQLMPRVEAAAATLVDARCDVVAFHCTANSTAEGLDGEEKLLAALRRAGAPEVTTTATAIRHALAALRARRIVLLTPYSAHTTEEEAVFLTKASYEVVYARGLRSRAATNIARRRRNSGATARSRRRGRTRTPICSAAPTFQCFRSSRTIEQKLDRPVVTSNQAVIFHALSLLRTADRRNCPGRLFDTLGEATSVIRVPA